jgi:hypothetical protein
LAARGVGRKQRAGRHRFEQRHALRQIRAAGIQHRVPGPSFAPDARQRRHRMRRLAVVVAQQHFHRIRIRSDHRDGLRLAAQRQHAALVFQQHDGFARHFQRQLLVLRAVVHAVWNLRPVRTISGGSNMPSRKRAVSSRRRAVSTSFSVSNPGTHGGHTFSYSRPQSRSVPAFSAAPRLRRRLGRELVPLVNIADRAAIGNHVAGEAPLPAQDIAQQPRIGAGGQAVHAVVRAHHGERAALFDGGFEMRQVAIAQVAIVEITRRRCGATIPVRCARRSAWPSRPSSGTWDRRPPSRDELTAMRR